MSIKKDEELYQNFELCTVLIDFEIPIFCTLMNFSVAIDVYTFSTNLKLTSTIS